MKANHIVAVVAILSFAMFQATASQASRKPLSKEIQKVIASGSDYVAFLTPDSFGYPLWTISKGFGPKHQTELVPCNIQSAVRPVTLVLKRTNPFGKHHSKIA